MSSKRSPVSFLLTLEQKERKASVPKKLVTDALVGFDGSKVEFSRATGIALSTLNHFADGSNKGTRPLIVLLTIFANHPEAARGLCAGLR